MKFFDYFYREELTLEYPWQRNWDLFFSSWDGSDRVRRVFSHVGADKKFWVIHPEYGIASEELPNEPAFVAHGSEAEAMKGVIGHAKGLCDIEQSRVCVDITGMLRPHIAILLRLLKHVGVKRFDAIYSEPDSYARRERTKFSSEEVSDVREITGFEGINMPGAQEVLIVAPGFDEVLLREIYSHKASAVRYQLFGLPSLKADMYQQNILRTYGIDTPMPDNEAASTVRFASASDPFAVATELSAIISGAQQRRQRSRFYIAPLGPKAQMLGAALYYMSESNNVAVSLIYPVVSGHEAGTSSGVSKVAINTVDFELLDVISTRH